jgi:hypothetical protein
MKFKELKIGQTFDWVNPAGRYNSFFQAMPKGLRPILCGPASLWGHVQRRINQGRIDQC